MTHLVLLDTALSVPLSALLSYLLHKRYLCSRRACLAAFGLGAYLALMFSATGLVPTPFSPPSVGGLLTRLTPLARLRESLPAALAAMRVAGNLLMMAPFALLTCLLFPEHRSLSRQLLLSLGLSLLIEGLQVALGRSTDVCDVALNLVGAAVGYGAYIVLARRCCAFAAEFEVRGTQCILYAYVLSTLVLLLIIGAFRMAF